MICFRDQAFCSSSSNDLHKGSCVNEKCYRNLTQELLNKAKKHELPISAADFKKSCCGYISELNQKENKK